MTPVTLVSNSVLHLSGPARSVGAVVCGYSGIRTFEPQVHTVLHYMYMYTHISTYMYMYAIHFIVLPNHNVMYYQCSPISYYYLAVLVIM